MVVGTDVLVDVLVDVDEVEVDVLVEVEVDVLVGTDVLMDVDVLVEEEVLEDVDEVEVDAMLVVLLVLVIPLPGLACTTNGNIIIAKTAIPSIIPTLLTFISAPNNVKCCC